jgi:serine/threonine-protein kinase
MVRQYVNLWLGLATVFFLPACALAQEAQPPQSPQPAQPSPELAIQAGEILQRACVRCHHGSGSESGYAFNVLNLKSLQDEGMLVAGKADESALFAAVYSGRMPPKNRPQLPRPSAAEIEVLRKWIDSGAAAIPAPAKRNPVSLLSELQAILKHLQQADRDDRPNLRYFSLTHLHNDSTVNLTTLQNARLALTKVLNSLSWEPVFVQPEPVNPEHTLFAVDITKLGWTRDHWNTLLKAYPYALKYGSLDDPALRDVDNDITDLRRDELPVVIRGDWMTAVGSKPPLYYTLLYDLELPDLQSRAPSAANPSNPLSMTDRDLERYLDVDVVSNFLNGRLVRSGYTHSLVSEQNRMIERHPLKSGGYYWKSYDFKSSNRTSILSEFPLGPAFPDNPFNSLAFEHDGGEIIFTLPNGLQGFLLVDGPGNRIDAGPIEVVADSLKTSGNEQIVAGVSCIACHRVGMIESPDDEVRPFSGAVNDARDLVRKLYPENDEFRKWIRQDRQSYVQALERLLDGLTGNSKAADLPEPVGEEARRYFLEPLSLERVAAELSVSPERLRATIEADPRLRELGLRVLLREGGSIKRAAWESPAAFPLMKQTARQFGFDPRN